MSTMIDPLQRNIPELKGFFPDSLMIGDQPSPENYLKSIMLLERDCDKDMKEVFRRISIPGIVKSDPYSLPFTHGVMVKLSGTGFSNAFEFYKVKRIVVNELLDKDLYKVRFYFF